MREPEKRLGEADSTLVAMARFSGHGLTLALATAFFLLVGWWLDGRLGTKPLLTIVGAMVGAGAGFYHMLSQMILIPRAEERRRKEESQGGPE